MSHFKTYIPKPHPPRNHEPIVDRSAEVTTFVFILQTILLLFTS